METIRPICTRVRNAQQSQQRMMTRLDGKWSIKIDNDINDKNKKLGVLEIGSQCEECTWHIQGQDPCELSLEETSSSAAAALRLTFMGELPFFDCCQDDFDVTITVSPGRDEDGHDTIFGTIDVSQVNKPSYGRSFDAKYDYTATREA